MPKADPPLRWGPLRFLYVGSKDTARDAHWYVEKAGARRVWHMRAFGAEVAALEVGSGPLLLLADHRPAGAVLPIYEVADLKATVAAMVKAGWKPEGAAFEVPNGPCRMFKDPSGNEVCLLQDVRPGAMEAAYLDPSNANAVRDLRS
jgi:catechol 2,3-dioxygenase-like lactoylglutathione lyase family enzyme